MSQSRAQGSATVEVTSVSPAGRIASHYVLRVLASDPHTEAATLKTFRV